MSRSIKSRALVNWWKEPRNPELNGYTQLIFRREVLGECTMKAQGTMKFWAFMRHVMDNQPIDPRRPVNEAERFHAAVAEQLRCFGFMPRKVRRLELYTAVNSGLDDRFGVRGFFRFEGMIVTIDCRLEDPEPEAIKRYVLVTMKDQIEGYTTPALDTAVRFLKGIKQGQKGLLC
jgi:hypothetical protein